jgi:Cof subfamily protein (haloacid dehalogenase superfamily)
MLYVSDLDGTLLQNDASLSAFARQSLSRLLQDGFPFTVATARGLEGMRLILKDLPLQLPVIAANGAFLSDYQGGVHHTIQALPPNLKSEIYAIIRRHGFAPIISTHQEGEDRIFYSEVNNLGMSEFEREKILRRDRRLRKVKHLDEILDEHIITFTLVDRREPLLDLEVELGERFPGLLEIHFYENIYQPGWYMFSILDRQATKAEALKKLARQVGVGPEEITVFGDNHNDLSMFHYAQHSVAVANAKPSVKAAATALIGPNTDDSVVHYLLQR